MVSIIVPCFNHEHYIGLALESIMAQSFSDWECIIVNDGSTDNSLEIIELYAKRDSRIRFINIKNSRVSIARNTAIKESRGVYLYPLDSDNKLHPECIAKCLEEFQRGTNIKLVYSEAELFGEKTGLWGLPEYDYKTMLKYNMVDNSSMFLREDFDRVGGYRLNMINGLEDWDFFIALLAPYAKEQIVKIMQPLYYYRVTDSSRRSILEYSAEFELMLDNIVYNNFQIYQKYFPNIFERVHEYDYNHLMMNKPLVKLIVRLYNQLHKLRKRVQ